MPSNGTEGTEVKGFLLFSRLVDYFPLEAQKLSSSNSWVIIHTIIRLIHLIFRHIVLEKTRGTNIIKIHFESSEAPKVVLGEDVPCSVWISVPRPTRFFMVRVEVLTLDFFFWSVEETGLGGSRYSYLHQCNRLWNIFLSRFLMISLLLVLDNFRIRCVNTLLSVHHLKNTQNAIEFC